VTAAGSSTRRSASAPTDRCPFARAAGATSSSTRAGSHEQRRNASSQVQAPVSRTIVRSDRVKVPAVRGCVVPPGGSGHCRLSWLPSVQNTGIASLATIASG
jgi:hypothetical protein